MPRTTRVVIAVGARPEGSYKDSTNTLLLALPAGAHKISEPTLLVSTQPDGPWGPPGTDYPNFVYSPFEITDTDSLKVFGFSINNRDEHLSRFVEATFIWEGDGPDIAQTSVDSFHGQDANSIPAGEGVTIGFSVAHPIPGVSISASVRESNGSWSSSFPPDMRAVPVSNSLHYPNGRTAGGTALAITNAHPTLARAVRITGNVSNEAPE